MSEETGLPTAQQIVVDNSTYNNPVIGAVQDYSGYKDYRTVDPYEFLEHTYDGSKHYRDCGYLQYFAREVFYQDRRKFSHYTNIFKPIINAMVDPVFAEDITRKTSNALFESFIENCDNSGTSLNVFMKNALKHARLFTLNFIVVDNFPAAIVAQAATMADQEKQRNFPYIYEKKPQQVYKRECDAQGKLVSITFYDKCETVKNAEGKDEERQYYKQWDAQAWRLFYIVKDNEVEESGGTHGLGKIPVVVMVDFADTANLKEFPEPAFYNMAVSCLALFCKKSMITWQEVTSTFPVMFSSGMDIKAIGTSTLLNCSTEAKFPPGFIEPPQDGMKTLVENARILTEDIFDLAKQKGVTGIQKVESGISKSYDFQAEGKVLEETAKAGERCEELIAEIFGLYIGSDVSYECDYPDDFDPSADENDITSALVILKEMPPEALAKALWLDIAKKRFGDDSDKIKEIEDALNSDMEAAAEIKRMQVEEAVLINQNGGAGS